MYTTHGSVACPTLLGHATQYREAHTNFLSGVNFAAFAGNLSSIMFLKSSSECEKQVGSMKIKKS